MAPGPSLDALEEPILDAQGGTAVPTLLPLQDHPPHLRTWPQVPRTGLPGVLCDQLVAPKGASQCEGGRDVGRRRDECTCSQSVKTPQLLSQTGLLEELAVEGDVASAGAIAEGLARQPHPVPAWSLGKLMTKRTVWLMSKTGPRSCQRDFGLVISRPRFPLHFTDGG